MKSQGDAFSIFCEAIELSPSKQKKFIEQACRDNLELRQEVETLLKANRDAGSFLADGGQTELHEPASRSLEEAPGSTIGQYKLLQKIGEGGFGVVFMAEQQRPVRRKVAIKIIKRGMDTREVIARFEAERQALALMEHPNIAQVFDGGETESGRPFFAMELVRGVPLTEFCDSTKLPLNQRLELFTTICRAIQHAHQKGVIHRDLKPSNVMICVVENRPVPKVIDFGVSKAVSQPLTEKTLFTAYGQVIGTPAYMSPEQAQNSGLDIDTRSDVYSLGVILYELLTGTTPLDTKLLRRAGYAEMLRLIAEAEAPTPSTRVLTLGDQRTTIAAKRNIEPNRLMSVLQRDLDWIVMCALDKDRSRRYATANELALDVTRYLNNEPVEACPPSATYRLKKMASKHRRALAVITSFLILLVLSACVSGYLAIRATSERDKADRLLVEEAQQRIRAEQLAKQSRQSLVRLYGATGSNAARLEDWSTALIWYEKSWRLDKDKSLHEESHRQRLGSVFSRMSVPAEIFFHGHSLRSLQLDSSGERLLTFARSNTVYVWGMNSGQSIESIEVPEGLIHASLSPDGNAVAICSRGGLVRLIDIQGRRRVIATIEHASEVNWVQFSHDGKSIATACDDHMVRFYAANSGEAEGTPIDASESVHYVTFQPKANLILTVDKNQIARLWSRTDGTQYGADLGHDLLPGKPADERFMLPVFYPDGKTLLTASEKELFMTRFLESGPEISTLDVGDIRSMSFSSDGENVLLLDDDATSSIRPVDDITERTILQHPRNAQCGAFCPTAPIVATASSGGYIHLWRFKKDFKKPVSSVLGRHAANVIRMTFSHNGRYLITGGMDGTVRVWDLEVLDASKSIAYNRNCGSSHRLEAQPDPADSSAKFVLGPDGKRQFRFDETGRGRIKAKAGTTGQPIEHGEPIIEAQFCADGSRLLTIGKKAARLWNATTGDPVGEPIDTNGNIYSVSLSDDGLTCGLIRRDRSASVYRFIASKGTKPSTKNLLGPMYRMEVPAEASEFTSGHVESGWFDKFRLCEIDPIGKRVALGSRKFVRVYDLKTGENQAFSFYSGSPTSVKFSPDGKRIVIASSNSTVRVWDLESGKPGSPPMHHPTYARYAEFSPDGHRVVTLDAVGRVRVWDASTGDLLVPALPPTRKEPERVWFSQDGRSIVAYASAKRVEQWQLPDFPMDEAIVSDLVTLLTSQKIDDTDGIVGVNRVEIRRDSAAFQKAWQSWRKH